MQLNGKVALHDVKDVEAFVNATITKGRLRLTTDEREELVCEGLRIMSHLANVYQPGKNGLNASQSKFSGFAAKYLPGKLSDAWHRMEEHHRLVTLPTGERKWHYDEPPASLDAIAETDTVERVRSLRADDVYDSDMAHTLRDALNRRWEHDRETTVRFAVLLGMDYTPADAAKALRIDAKEAALVVERIKRVAHELQPIAA